mmetsp:Transcript_76851/g.121357  ORF Transcript_76851/g.121357 Transcript_76851/m.121357 type:complete len:182 (+) Transcript_76851:52-597(+)
MMRQLEISLAVQAEIDNTWNRIDQEDWLLIEEKALEWLEADLAAKANLLRLPILSEVLPKYIGFEDAEIDRAVFEAAFWVLGRPAFTAQWSRRNTETSHFNDSIEDPLLTELDVPAVCSGSLQRMSRLQIALAWGRSRSESMNATVDANEAVLSELEIHIPKSPSSPLPSSRPNVVLRAMP